VAWQGYVILAIVLTALGFWAPSPQRGGADIRVPLGLGKDEVTAKIHQLLARYPEATVEEVNYSVPSTCNPSHAMAGILRAIARVPGRPEPVSICLTLTGWTLRNES